MKLNILNKIYQFFDRTVIITCVVTITVMLSYMLWSRSQTMVFDEVYPNGASIATELAFTQVDGKALVMVFHHNESPKKLASQLSTKYALSINEELIQANQKQFKDELKSQPNATTVLGTTYLHNYCLIISSVPEIKDNPFLLLHEIGHCVQEFNSGSYAFEYFPTESEYTDAFEKVSGFSREISKELLKSSGYIINREVFADMYAYYHLYTLGLMNHNEILTEIASIRSVLNPITELGYGSRPFLTYVGKHPVKKGERFPDFYTRVMNANLDKIDTPEEFAIKKTRIVKAALAKKNARIKQQLK